MRPKRKKSKENEIDLGLRNTNAVVSPKGAFETMMMMGQRKSEAQLRVSLSHSLRQC